MMKWKMAERPGKMNEVSIIWTLCVQIIDSVVVFF